jgi:hypothetical protein
VTARTLLVHVWRRKKSEKEEKYKGKKKKKIKNLLVDAIARLAVPTFITSNVSSGDDT